MPSTEMSNTKSPQKFAMALVVSATIFGMVLAGGTDLVSGVHADPEPQNEESSAVIVAPEPMGLPGFADLAAAVSPAVVSIQATKIERASDRRGQDPFGFFFGPRGRDPREEPREQPQNRRRSDSAGSGFVVSGDGYIVTNHHVIEDASDLTVILNDRQYKAELKGDDPATDLALLKIEAEGELPHLRLADSSAVRVGDWVMVIGSPLQLQNSVSVGVVSAKGRSINITPDSGLENFIQTDAAINFGNSGGPVVDLTGAVVGIATAINFGAENIGFAVPSNTLQGIMTQLRDHGSVRRGYLGVNIDDLDHMEAEAFGLDSTDGALITNVIEDGPSEAAGLEHEDVIIAVDGKKVRSNRELIDRISAHMPGDEVEVTLIRDGKQIKKDIRLGERPPGPGVEIEPEPEEEAEEEVSIDWLGVTYQNLTSTLRSAHSLPDGLRGVWITSVEPDSPFYDKGVRPGDIVTEVQGEPVATVGEFQAAIKGQEAGSAVRFYLTRVGRGGTTASFFAVIRVP